jgi:hypothetical protein
MRRPLRLHPSSIKKPLISVTPSRLHYRLIPRRCVGRGVGEGVEKFAQRVLAQLGQRGGGLDFAFEGIERREEHSLGSIFMVAVGVGDFGRGSSQVGEGGKAPRPHTPGGDPRARLLGSLWTRLACRRPGWGAGGYRERTQT